MREYLSHVWRTVIGGTVVDSDSWHGQRPQMRTDDNADLYAFTRFMLVPNWGMGNGVCTWENWEMLQPPLPVLQSGPMVNFNGLVAGNTRITALLLSQRQAVDRGLETRSLPSG